MLSIAALNSRALGYVSESSKRRCPFASNPLMVNSFALPGISFPRYHCFHTTGPYWRRDPVEEQAGAVEMSTKSSMPPRGHSQPAFMKEIFHLAERREVQQVSDEIHPPLTHPASYHFGVA